MDDTDGDRADSAPFGDELVPANRRVRSDRDSTRTVPDVDALTGAPQVLESGVQGLWMLRSAISATVLAVIAGVAFSILEVGGPWIGGVVFAIGLVVGVVFSVLRYRVWRYQVRSDSLYLKRGVLTRVTTVAPHVRIQHVDTRRGPLERSFGLATTVVYTAGSRGADVSIPGLTPERADDLQGRLKHLAIVAEGEDAV
jgi:membrane protein YdbS with pleckstrin-like domain